jgi:hypothetical protein
MQCACCGRPLDARSAWKGAGSQFYCSEFCSDSETPEATRAASPATLLHHHLHRPYERLEHLLPYMRRFSAQTVSAHRAG